METPDMVTALLVVGVMVCVEAIILVFLTMRQQWLYENIEQLREENRKFHEVPEAELVSEHIPSPDSPFVKTMTRLVEGGRVQKEYLKFEDLDDLPEKNDMGEPWVDENEETKQGEECQ